MPASRKPESAGIDQAMKPLKDLPDLEGFEFIGIDAEGTEHACHMRQLVSTRKFYVAGISAFTTLTGWEHKPK
jgi:hypothetical protein